MAQAGDRFADTVERPHEFPRRRRLTEQVRIDEAPGQQQPVGLLLEQVVAATTDPQRKAGLQKVLDEKRKKNV